MPRELSKTILPSYRIEPPDVLSVEAIRLVPKETYELKSVDVVRIKVRRSALNRIVPADVVTIRAPEAPAVAPIDGQYVVQLNGSVMLGELYGSVDIGFLTVEEAKQRIEEHLATKLVKPNVLLTLDQAADPIDEAFTIGIDGTVDFGPYGSITLAGLTIQGAKQALTQHFARYFDDPHVTIAVVEGSLQQQVTGEHLVGPDGTLTLGAYGSVPVVGLTVDEAADAIEQHLTEYIDNPNVAVTVYSFNSKFYYIILEGAGYGDQALRFPVTGNETVLDAITLINGLTEVSSSRMWIARASSTPGDYHILPVDWREITSLGAANSNYQLLPGDRLYIAQDHLVAFDRALSKLTAPLERIMGFSLLGAETATRLSGKVLQGGGNPRGRSF